MSTQKIISTEQKSEDPAAVPGGSINHQRSFSNWRRWDGLIL